VTRGLSSPRVKRDCSRRMTDQERHAYSDAQEHAHRAVSAIAYTRCAHARHPSVEGEGSLADALKGVVAKRVRLDTGGRKLQDLKGMQRMATYSGYCPCFFPSIHEYVTTR